jgi:hypothetical protein
MAVACVLVLAGGGAVCSSAYAVSPITLSPGQITDQVGALGSARNQVQTAIDQLYSAKGIDLHVAYVKDFSGESPTTWADETAQRSGMGVNDVLLAVATSARQYGLSVDSGFQISQSALNQVATVAIEPSLRNSQWAAAAIGATQGLAQAAAGQVVTKPTFDSSVLGTGTTSSSSSNSSTSSTFWIVLGFLALATVAVVGFLLYSRRRAAARPAGPGQASGPSIKELEEQAARMLVETDDAIRTSEQELGFAIAQFGQESATGFSTALDTAKQELADAFRLRARLDGDTPVPEVERYQALRQIVEKCTRANAALDAQTTAFEDLRDLQHRAPEVLAQLDALLAGAPELIQKSNTSLSAAAARFSPQALEPVAQNPEQARQLVTFATGAIAQAKSDLAADRQGQAAVATRTAQEALGQVGQLTSAVDRRLADLEQARDGLAAIIAEVDGEIVQGRGLLEGADATAVARLGGLEQEAAVVKAEVQSGHGDPLDQLGRLQAVDAQLDELLLGLQSEHDRRAGARAMLEQALLGARSDVAAAQDFITTRRGAIGSQARTLQAEAERRLSTAMSLQATDPTAALEAARQASSYARSAQQQASSDLNGFGGGMGMGGGGRSGSAGGGMAGGALGGLLGAVLGGIATEAMRSGGGRSRAGPAVRQPGGFQGAPGGGRRSTGGRF